MSFTPTTIIPSLWGWTDFTAALPSFYWDVESAEQRIKKICCELHKVCEYANMLGENINIDHALIDELQVAFEKFMESGFDDYYKQEIERWVNKNLPTIFEKFVKSVYFGLTLDGYFVAYIPESWDDIIFSTGMNFESREYGRLILSYDVDSPYNVDQS